MDMELWWEGQLAGWLAVVDTDQPWLCADLWVAPGFEYLLGRVLSEGMELRRGDGIWPALALSPTAPGRWLRHDYWPTRPDAPMPDAAGTPRPPDQTCLIRGGVARRSSFGDRGAG